MAGGRARPSGFELVSDDALVEAVQRGDERIASEIFARLFDTVDGTLYRVLGQRGSDHDDLVQQVFEQIVLTLSRHAFARLCSLRTWGARVATNVGLNALRSRRRERQVIDWGHELDDDLVRSSSPDPARAVESQRRAERLRLELVELKPARVEVLLLHDLLGHDLGEIALMLGASVAAVQSRLFRGRRDLRKRLERAGFGPKEGTP